MQQRLTGRGRSTGFAVGQIVALNSSLVVCLIVLFFLSHGFHINKMGMMITVYMGQGCSEVERQCLKDLTHGARVQSAFSSTMLWVVL